MYKFMYNSPIGEIRISYNQNAITGLDFLPLDSDPSEDSPILNECLTQLDEYFAGKRQTFSINIEFTRGTDYQKKVWAALCSVNYGETASYKDIASLIGNSKAARAIGSANNKNPISIIVPCHRIIGTSGKMVGYGGGIEKKIWLLEHEKNNKI